MGGCQSKDEHFGAWVRAARAPTIRCMTSDRIDDHASALLEAARDLQKAASERGSSEAATAALESLEAALQALSGAWYQVAADAVPGIPARQRRAMAPPKTLPAASRRLSREQEVRLVVTLHDVAAAFARCARTCRRAQPIAGPLIDGLVPGGQTDARASGVNAPGRERQQVA